MAFKNEKNVEKVTPKFFDPKLVDELYEFYLSDEQKDKEDIKAKKANVIALYKEFDANLKVEVKENILKLKEEYKKTLVEIENTKVEGLKKANEDFSAIAAPTAKDKKEHQNVVNGVNIVAKRAKIKAEKDLFDAIKAEKLRRFDLHVEYTNVLYYVTETVSPFDALKSKNIENAADFNLKRAFTNKKMWADLIPLFMLIIIIVAYVIAKNAYNYKADFSSIINNCIFVAVVATGAVFIYSQGGFDMSLGNAALTCALVCGLVYKATNNLALSLIVSVAAGALLGTINAIFATMLNLPVMVMTLTMMNILSAINDQILGGNEFDLGSVTGMIKSPIIYGVFLLVFFILCYLIFNYTKVGRRNKFIGSNKVAAKFNGINLMRAGIVSFAISGVGLGLCGFIFANSKAGFSFGANTPLSQVGLNVIIAIVFGGMTTSGGPKSKVTCAIIGAFFVVFFEQFFNAMNMHFTSMGAYKYLAKGIIFIIVSLANMWDTRTKRLAAGGSIQ